MTLVGRPCRARILGLAVVVLALAGCHADNEVSLPTLARGEVRVRPDAGPWRPVPVHEEIRGPWRVAQGGFGDAAAPAAAPADPFAAAPQPPAAPAPVALPPRPAPAPTPPPAPRLAVPRRRGAREARPAGVRTARSPEQLAREHYLDYPTRIRAARVTLYLPPAYAGEVKLEGRQVERGTPARQWARGHARLVLRELTLEGDRVTLRVRSDGRDDLQIIAHGNVELVSEVRGNVMRQQGLKSLIVTNDQLVPLR